MPSILTAEGLAKVLQKIKAVFATKSELTSQADELDANCVHKTGNETIAGTKTFSSTISGTADKALKDGAGNTIASTYASKAGATFTGQLKISRNNGTNGSPGIMLVGEAQNFALMVSDTSVTKGTAPAATRYMGIDFYGTDTDNYNKRLGMVEYGLSTANLSSISLRAYNTTTNTSTTHCSITACVDGSGNAYTSAPTPAAGDSSTKIATTAFVANAAVYKTGDESIAGVKTFTDIPHVNNNIASIGLHTSDFVKGTNPTTSRWGGVYLGDNAMDNATTKRYSCYEANVATSGNASSYLRSYIWTTGSTSNAYAMVMQPASGAAYVETNAMVRPSANGTLALGDGSHRWSAVYAANATIQTSDARLKQDIADISDEILDAWDKVKWRQFRMKNSVLEKGESARLHSGIIAQEAEEALASKSVDPSRYGFWCYDEWQEQPARLDSDGKVEAEAIPSGSQYSVRYEEALAIEAAYLRRRCQRLEERISALEAKGV